MPYIYILSVSLILHLFFSFFRIQYENIVSRGLRKDIFAVTRYILLALAWICFFTGCVGVVVPLLPTTPLILLATILFARSSPRCYDYIQSTRVYKTYVVAFREAGGITLSAKIRMLAVSYTVMGISAFLAAKPIVWCILGTMALFLFWLMIIHIPTLKSKEPEQSSIANQPE